MASLSVYILKAHAADGVGSLQDSGPTILAGDPDEVVTRDVGLIYLSPVISVTKLNDAAENGTDGTFEFARTGDRTSSLTVNYTVSGTATAGTNYTALSGSVTFAAGSSTADVSVATIDDGVTDDPDQTVTLTVGSGTGYTVSSPSVASLSIIDTDIPPAAYDASETTNINTALNVSVLDLATDFDGDTLTTSAVTQGTHGSVVINLDGTVTYTPDTGYTGDDSFTYTVTDTFGNTSTGAIYVSVTGPEAPPTSVWTATNTAVSIDVPDLAFDPDGETLSTSAVTQGTHGTVTINLDGTVTYTPNTGYTGGDSFDYTVEDGNGNTATQTITVTVGPINPIALDGDATTPVNTPVDVAVLDLSSQPAGGSLTTTAVTQGTHGSVAINMDGTVTYTPNTGFSGTDTFQYTITDSNSNTATGAIGVTVGTPAETDEEAAEDNLAGMSENITGYISDISTYTSSAATALTSAATGISATVGTYLSDVTSFISAHPFDQVGENLAYIDFLQLQAQYNTLSKEYNTLLGLESAAWTMLSGATSVVNFLGGQLTAAGNAKPPNAGQITDLANKFITASTFHRLILIEIFVPLRQETLRAHQEAQQTYLAMRNAALRAGNPQLLLLFEAPPELPLRNPKDYVPKKLGGD